MGWLDGLAGQAAQALGGQAAEAVGGALSGGAQELVSPQTLQALAGWLGGAESGGLAGLVQQFGQQGLGEVLQSWASGDQPLPISAAQLQAVLGNAQVQSVARALGFEPEQALQALVSLLPQAVKLLSAAGGPGGTEALVQQGLSLLGGFGGLGSRG